MPKIYRERKSVVRRLREHMNMFQAELAEMIGVNQTMVSRFERFEDKPSEWVSNKLIEIAHRYGFKLTKKMLREDYE